MPRDLDAKKLTWKEFKELCEQRGVKDSDELDTIDISWGSTDDFECKKDPDFGWQISLRSF